MPHNCSNENARQDKSATCPANGESYRAVPFQTVMHHTKKAWLRNLNDQGYFFCTDPDCDVVYFSSDNSTISRREIRKDIGQKSRSRERTICYCFDVSWSDIENNPQACKEFVTAQTRQGSCDCVIRNPSGKCCLKDFPKQNTG